MPKKYYKKFDTPKNISDKKLQQIINFYLLNCPVPGKSVRGKKFSDYGFSKSPPFSKLKAAMLASASASLSKNYYPCRKEELEGKFDLVENVAPPDEYCVFLKRDESRVMDSLFSAIRNAFAHGSYNVKLYGDVRIYFLNNYYKYEKARIVLREKTLLAWIKLVESGYKSLQNNHQRRKER